VDWDSPYIEALITAALAEEVGSGDVATAAIFSPYATASAQIVAGQDLVCAGLPLVERAFGRLDAEIAIELHASEGQALAKGASLVDVSGNAAAILTGMQTVLNLLSRPCGMATLTRQYVQRIVGTVAKISNSRNSAPGLRRLEQYAVHVGGGNNRHTGLFDAILLTPAHVAAAGGIKAALDQAHSHASRLVNSLPLTAYEATGTGPAGTHAASLPIRIAVRDEDEIREALLAGAESILLDGVSAERARRLSRFARSIRPDCEVEIRGEIPLAEVRAYAESGANYISPEAIVSAPRARLSLRALGQPAS